MKEYLKYKVTAVVSHIKEVVRYIKDREEHFYPIFLFTFILSLMIISAYVSMTYYEEGCYRFLPHDEFERCKIEGKTSDDYRGFYIHW